MTHSNVRDMTHTFFRSVTGRGGHRVVQKSDAKQRVFDNGDGSGVGGGGSEES